jgi:hypothetical protein
MALHFTVITKSSIPMPLSNDLQRKLSKKFEGSSTVSMNFRGNDIIVKTDSEGNAMTMFIGKLKDGVIRGQRYSRTLKVSPAGEVIKDHWDLKGKV